MSRTSEEYERLRRQSELLESITGSVLNRVGLSTGMSCLDLGCGPGEVMRLLVSAWRQKAVEDRSQDTQSQ
jgi:trans-aconitate methyltransferase